MSARSRLHVLFLATVSAVGVSHSASAQCHNWNPNFRLPGPAGEVTAMTAFDAGSGPVLYVGGAFTDAEGVPANHIAQWNGSTWSALGSGLDGGVTALTVFDDGTGPAIYAAGSFATAGGQPANSIAKWDGAAWSALGSGTDGGLSALAVFDDGNGPALYVGGTFAAAGGVAANNIARWDGTAWSAVAQGTDGGVAALIVFQDSSGSALYAGGAFTTAGNAPANNIGKWDGMAWSAVGSGVDYGVASFAVFDEGSGPALHAGFSGVFEWDGVNWLPVGANSFVEADSLTAFDDGTGPALYAGSTQSVVIQKWNGVTWSDLPLVPIQEGFHGAVLGAFDDGHGTALYAGFDIHGAPYTIPLGFAKWNGVTWVPVGTADGLTGGAASLAVFDDGSGPALYAGGGFPAAGSTAATNVAKYDGYAWSALGDGVQGGVQAMCAVNVSGSRSLYVAGTLSVAGDSSVNNIARWNGSSWSALGDGLLGGQYRAVQALTEFDDGTGPALYAAGEFTIAGGQPANHIARWDGASWSPLGQGTDGPVYHMTAFDNGSGPVLYVSGAFARAGTSSAHGIAAWNGSTWAALGADVLPQVDAMAVYNDGSGPALYVGSGGSVLKWDGSVWSSIGIGVFCCFANAMTVFDDGFGPALYVGAGGAGEFGSVVKWDGTTWSDLTFWPVYSIVTSFVAFTSSAEEAPGLYMGLYEPALVPYASASGIAEWRGCGQAGVPFCFGDGTTGTCPCGNSGAIGHGCENSASTGGAVLDASGLTSLAFDSLKLVCQGERATALSVFVQGSLEVAPVVYGDGLRCFGGHAKRLFIKHAVGGVASAPEKGDPSISAQSAAQGDPLYVGSTRVYQTYYRDPKAAFCPSPPGNTWNISNARRIQWLP